MAEQFINNFNGGMFKDTSPMYQPDGTYRDLRNFEVVSHDGNTFSLKDSLGNRLIITIPPGYTDDSPLTLATPGMPIGFISFPDKLIVFSTSDETDGGGYGEIGQIYLTNIGQSVEAASVSLTLGNSAVLYSGYVPLYRHDDLKFSKMHKIEGFGFKENDAIERVYWTDNNNQPRVFDIADSIFSTYYTPTAGGGDLPLVSGTEYMVLSGIIEHPVASGFFYGPAMPLGNIFTASTNTYSVITGVPLVIKYFDVDLINFTPARTLGQILFKNFGSGTKLCGNHEYFYRLLKGTTGYKTSWSYGSFPVHVGDNISYPTASPLFSAAHNYVGKGSTSSLITSSKSIQLTITDIDTKFDTIELACVEYIQDIDIPYQIRIVATKAIDSTTLNSDGSIDVEDFGNVNLGTLTIDDITLAPANILKCKTLTTNKNYKELKNVKNKNPLTPFEGDPVWPLEIDTPQVRQEWNRWLTYKHAKRKTYKTLDSHEAALRRCAKVFLTPERTIAAIEYSIAQGWDGIYEETKNEQLKQQAQILDNTFKEINNKIAKLDFNLKSDSYETTLAQIEADFEKTNAEIDKIIADTRKSGLEADQIEKTIDLVREAYQTQIDKAKSEIVVNASKNRLNDAQAKQAIAIALSEAGQSKKMMSGGLSGNQSKIDINKDGKISGEDFKMLKTKNKRNGGMSDGQATKGFGIEKKRGGGIATRGMGLALRGGGMAQRGTGMALKDGGSVNEHKRMAMGKKII